MASTQPSAEAVAVENGRIVAVGSPCPCSGCNRRSSARDRRHICRPSDPAGADRPAPSSDPGATTLATEVIATEDWVLPDRTYPAANTHDEYVDALRSADRRTRTEGAGDDDWLFSWGYHQLWHGDLSRQVLDSVSLTRPIGVWQRSCHEFYLNTAGLKSLGILDDGWGDGIDPESSRPRTSSRATSGSVASSTCCSANSLRCCSARTADPRPASDGPLPPSERGDGVQRARRDSRARSVGAVSRDSRS